MTFSSETIQRILTLVLPSRSDFGSVTIRQALIRLLSMMWTDPDDFNAYRPLGNSDWPEQIIDAVIHAGLAENWDEANAAIKYSIGFLAERD